MKAITLHQPWATCIAEYGKDVENRGWRPSERMIGERIAIHAGAHLDPDALRELQDDEMVPASLVEEDFPRSCVVAVARLVDVVEGGFNSDWREQTRYGWVLGDVQTLGKPVPCRGYQGLWKLRPWTELDVRAALGEGCRCRSSQRRGRARPPLSWNYPKTTSDIAVIVHAFVAQAVEERSRQFVTAIAPEIKAESFIARLSSPEVLAGFVAESKGEPSDDSRRLDWLVSQLLLKRVRFDSDWGVEIWIDGERVACERTARKAIDAARDAKEDRS